MRLDSNRFKFLYEFIKKNKYILTVVIFFLLILFFHPSNIFKIIKNEGEISELRKQEKYYKDKIQNDSVKYNELNKDNTSLEKFAREQYYFHKSNEEVFVIEKHNK